MYGSSVRDFLISTGQLATGISNVSMGCCSCEPLFPVAVEIHWEISWEIVQNAVVGLILTLATRVAKTSGKDQILLVSCCQVLEKTDFITGKLDFEMENKCLLMQHEAPWKPFVCIWQFHTLLCLFRRDLESFAGEQSLWWGIQHKGRIQCLFLL